MSSDDMESSISLLNGHRVAASLAGAWRRHPPSLVCSADALREIAPLLLDSGAAALAWHRVRETKWRASPEAAELQQAYRLHTLQAALHERNIIQVFSRLRAAGVEPLLVKGWAIARLYPEQGLRPYGDIDLCVRPDQYQTVERLLRTQGNQYPVDLHRGTSKLDERSFAELSERSQLIQLEDVQVRVLCAEDHFRVLCFHALRHGMWRPLWLCDIAAALECRPADFDWDHCLSGNRRRARWIACVIHLAHRLLGAQTGALPKTVADQSLPSWFVPSVLKQWSVPFSQHVARQNPMATFLRRPQDAWQALRLRWPNPIEATVGIGGSFNDFPRWPFQIGHGLRRAAQFFAALARSE